MKLVRRVRKTSEQPRFCRCRCVNEPTHRRESRLHERNVFVPCVAGKQRQRIGHRRSERHHAILERPQSPLRGRLVFLCGQLGTDCLASALVAQHRAVVRRTEEFREAYGDSINASLAELFCAADHGTVLGYERRGEAVSAGLAAEEDEPAPQGGLRSFQDGVMAFTAAMTDALPLLAGHTRDEHVPFMQAGLATVRRLIHTPTAAEARLLGSFPHSANQFHSSFSSLAPAVPAWM